MPASWGVEARHLAQGAAPVYILVAFRPAAALPSLSDAQRARAAAKRQQPVMEAGGPDGWQ
jgi:hypothetical protein